MSNETNNNNVENPQSEPKFNLQDLLKKTNKSDEDKDKAREVLVKNLKVENPTDKVINKGLNTGDIFEIVNTSYFPVKDEKTGDIRFNAPMFITKCGRTIGCRWFNCGCTAIEIADFVINNYGKKFVVSSKTQNEKGNNVYVVQALA